MVSYLTSRPKIHRATEVRRPTTMSESCGFFKTSWIEYRPKKQRRIRSELRELVVAIFGFEPRPKQLDGLVCSWVIAKRKDKVNPYSKKVIWKKSYSPSSPFATSRPSHYLHPLPQCYWRGANGPQEKVARLPGAKPIHIQADNVDQNGLLMSVCQD
jgi:hypothetical protein